MKINILIESFIAYALTHRRMSANTIAAYKQDLNQFHVFCIADNIHFVGQINKGKLVDFLGYLKTRGVSSRSIARKVVTLKTFYCYAEERFNVDNCAKDLTSPRIEKKLPSYLSLDELEQFFSVIEQDSTLLGKRNAIMIYLMYVAGMRVSELIFLRTSHIQRENRTIVVEGKRGKQRLIPLPESLMQKLLSYLDVIRPALLKKIQSSDLLFPIIYSKKAKPMTRQALWIIIKQIWKKTGCSKSISPHTLRHSFATHMLAKGANLRSLQLLLGHEQLATVQIYTQVEKDRLRMIYDKKHPRSH